VIVSPIMSGTVSVALTYTAPDYNTTLPYPGADLSPYATISSDGLSPSQSMKKRRLSMLSKHRRTVSQNSTISQSMHGVLPLIASSVPGRSSSPSPSSGHEGSASAEGNDSIMHEDETPPTSPEMADKEDKRRSVFGMFRRKSVKG
jgi:hypothetical protein